MGKLDLTVPAAEANRSFSKLLRVVRDGGRVTITAYGQPVAELGPPAETDASVEKARLDEAFAALQARLAQAPRIVVGPWSRDDLYKDD
jgi:prevent-host-death family protein